MFKQSRRNLKAAFSPDEDRIIAKYAGKEVISRITARVNEVSRVTRNDDGVRARGNGLGYSFRLSN